MVDSTTGGTANHPETKGGPTSNFILGVLSGPIIYTIHFLAVYFLVETACQSGLYRAEVMGFNLVKLLIFLLTLVAAGVAGVATWLSYRRWQQSKRDHDQGDLLYRQFLSLAGIGLNGFHGLLIVLTGIPTLLLVLCESI